MTRAPSRLRITVAAILAVSPALPYPARAQDDACGRGGSESAVALSASDTRSIRLADGRELRLAGLAYLGPGTQTSAGRAARQALDERVRGRPVTWHADGGGSDRYGRVSAYVFVNRSETPLQYNLLAAGYAAAAPQADPAACRNALLQHEKTARNGRLGLWSDPGYVIKAADGARLMARAGRFAVVEGEVVSVRRSGGTIYINFGRRWSEALTVTIDRRLEPAFAAAGLAPRKIERRRLRVRGYIERRNGPVIAAAGPEQIELDDR